jgi:hypothetical protein
MIKNNTLYIFLGLVAIIIAAAGSYIFLFSSSPAKVVQIQQPKSTSTIVHTEPIANIATTSQIEANGTENQFTANVIKMVGSSTYEVQVVESATDNPKGTIVLYKPASENAPVVGGKCSFATYYNSSKNWYEIARTSCGGQLPPEFAN